jgi:mannose-1-phosphate guanylyltransferase
MAGGSGTRFWPLSRTRVPKQLQTLVGEEPLVRSTVKRFDGLVRPGNIYVVTGKEQEEATRNLLSELPAANIVAEPEGRDTAAAVALGAAVVHRRDPAAIMAVRCRTAKRRSSSQELYS